MKVCTVCGRKKHAEWCAPLREALKRADDNRLTPEDRADYPWIRNRQNPPLKVRL